MFILDEADEMLSRGFKDQIYDVFRTLSENIQVSWHLDRRAAPMPEAVTAKGDNTSNSHAHFCIGVPSQNI